MALFEQKNNMILNIVNHTQNILDVLRNEEETAQEISDRILGLCDIVSKISKLVDDDVYEEYQEFFDSMKIFMENCKNCDFLVENVMDLDSILALFIECLRTIVDTNNKLYKKCDCCGEMVRYLPIPDLYREEAKKHGYVNVRGETINGDAYTCPVCGASDRDRMIVSYFKKNHLREAREDFKVLQIAPAQSIEYWIKTRCPHIQYESTDLYMDGVTFKSDVQDMNMVANQTYDLIICSHVLEHVKDDVKALHEFKRILKDDGQLVFLVPIDLNSTDIDEEWGCSEEENWRRFGQGDHCRKYGKQGLVERLQSVFHVKQFGYDYFGEEVFDRCALIDTSTLYILTKDENVSLDFECELEIDEELLTNGPLVTVLLSAYNHGAFVADTVESVINQTYKNIEFIVADDGSPDNTAEVLKKYEKYYAKSLYFKDNAGTRYPEIAKLATGDYIALIHSDDVWDPDKLAIQMTYLMKHPECGACLSWCDYTDENLNVSDEVSIFYQGNRTSDQWIRFFWDNGNALCNPSSVMKREYRLETATYGGDCWQIPDLLKWIDLVQKTEIHIVPRVLTRMRRYNTKARANVSTVTNETTIRHMFESGTHWVFYVRDMNNELFKKAFYDVLIDKNANTDEEIMCEKYFLLLKSKNPFIQNSSFYYLSENYLKMNECLHEKYHYWLKEIKHDVIHSDVGSHYMN